MRAVSRQPKHRRTLAWSSLVLTCLLVLAEGGIIWLVFRSEGGFFFYWRPFHGLMTLLAAMLPCLIVISSMVAFFASAKSRSQRLIWTATGIAFLVFPLCLASWVAWYMLAFNIGGGQTVAQAELSEAIYRLEFNKAGDPPMAAYDLYECRPFPWWCRGVGHFSPVGDPFMDAEPAAILSQEGLGTVFIGFVPVGRFEGGRFNCMENEKYTCSKLH